jgi:hypothetical protein
MIWISECMCTKPSTVQSDWTVPKLWMWVTYTFIALEMNIFHGNVYILYIQYIHTLHVHVSDSGTYTIQDEAVNPLTPRKYTDLNGIFCLICAMFFRNVTLAYESYLHYVSLFENIHCLGTHSSHCHDTFTALAHTVALVMTHSLPWHTQ